jgi:hypothetical protein
MKNLLNVKFRHLLILTALTFFIGYGCKDDGDEVPSELTATIGHFGFDFSAGQSDTVNWENNDGEVITWFPGSGNHHPLYPNNGAYLWYRNDQVAPTDYKTKTYDFGETNFADIKNIPTAWDTLPNPLLPGHVMVVKCHDGYAKFKINSVDTTHWEATVTYMFTDGSSF